MSAQSLSWFHCQGPRTILQAKKRVVEAGIGQQGGHLAGRRIVNQDSFCFEGVHANLVLGVDTDEFIRAELKEFGRCPAGEREDDQDPPLSEDIDLATSKLRIACSDSEKGLDRITRDRTNSGVYTAAGKLVGKSGRCGKVRLPAHDLHHLGRMSRAAGHRTDLSGRPIACPVRSEPFCGQTDRRHAHGGRRMEGKISRGDGDG